MSATLLVGTFSTRCSSCNGGCSPYDVTHEKCIGYGEQPPGCGVLFTHIVSTYAFPGSDERMAQMRPDLIVIPIDTPAPTTSNGEGTDA